MSTLCIREDDFMSGHDYPTWWPVNMTGSRGHVSFWIQMGRFRMSDFHDIVPRTRTFLFGHIFWQFFCFLVGQSFIRPGHYYHFRMAWRQGQAIIWNWHVTWKVFILHNGRCNTIIGVFDTKSTIEDWDLSRILYKEVLYLEKVSQIQLQWHGSKMGTYSMIDFHNLGND